ncbi:MAG: hypothetical protein P4L42_07145 [Desulfocapsaceae bacterium]|nr:hypothetical protein [Desulfocapsaceae bacterium]
MDEMKELEKLRLEFLKRGKDQGTGAIYRAELALEHREQPTVCVKIPQSGPDSVGSFVDGCKHFYQLPPLTLNVNLYATLEEIEEGIKKAVVDAVMGRISFNKQLMDFDNPESTPPELKARGQGIRYKETTFEELRVCLQAYDLEEEGKSRIEIQNILYPGQDRATAKQKVYQKIIKTRKLIEAASQGTGYFTKKVLDNSLTHSILLDTETQKSE